MGESGGFNASLTNDGFKIIKNMIQDSQCLRFLSFPAALVATGTRGFFVEVLRREKRQTKLAKHVFASGLAFAKQHMFVPCGLFYKDCPRFFFKNL